MTDQTTQTAETPEIPEHVPIAPVTLEEVRAAAPQLPVVQQSELYRALSGAQAGAKVEVSFTYQTQTDSTKVKRRKAGVDYVARPGVSYDVHFGLVTGKHHIQDGVFRTKKAQALRFRIKDEARPKGAENWSWKTTIPTGITEFAVTGYEAPEQAPPQ
jgi:hypothetical protein